MINSPSLSLQVEVRLVLALPCSSGSTPFIYSLCGNFGSPVKTLVIDTGLIAIENVGTVLFLSF